MIHLVLSLDYEIFGNGSGDVRRDMIEPARRLLTLCDGYGAKTSIMLEVGEYWAMKKAEAEGTLCLRYSPSREIEQQVRNAILCGHDVQLHLHPWWIGASFKEGNWHLHPQYRRITDLPNGLGSEDDAFSVIGVLCEGKRTLESMVRPVCSDYQCLVYRAAMFWGQPSRDLILGIRRAGLIGDSSVIPGLRETFPVLTDYRGAPSAAGYWWTCADDIARPGPQGEQVIEFPVYARLRPYVYNLKWTKLSATLKRRFQESSDTHGHAMMEARQSTEPLSRVLRRLGTRQPLKYDFCKLSAGDMICELRRLMKSDLSGGDGLGTPVVMLGHSKDFWNDGHLAAFLRFVKEECAQSVRFSTLAECTRAVLQRDNRWSSLHNS